MSPTPTRRFHTAAESDIKSGAVSDVYFERTVEILRHLKDRKRVKAFGPGCHGRAGSAPEGAADRSGTIHAATAANGARSGTR